MRILQLVNTYLQPGGESETVKDICDLLAEYGQDIVQYVRSNEEIHRYSILDKVLFPINTIYSLRSSGDIRKLLTDSHIDVMHVHNVMPLISASVLYSSLKRKVPIVQHLHNYRLFCANGLMLSNGQPCEKCLAGNYLCAIRDKCYRNDRILSTIYAGALVFHRSMGVYKRVHHFIAVSEFIKKIYVRFGLPPNKITVLYNFVRRMHNEKTQKDKGYIVYVGRLSQEKGIMTLLISIRKLRSQIRLCIIGDGPQKRELEEYAKKYNLNVLFLGYLSRTEVDRRIHNARVLILPSECYESFGRVIVEAYSHSIPVVASRIGGIPEIVDDKSSGILFTPGDPFDLAEKLDWILSLSDNTFKNMKKHATEIARNHFDRNDYQKKLLRIYEDASSKKSFI